MRKPADNIEIFARRRRLLAERAKGSAIIIPSHPEMIRNNDVHHPYRQDSNLFYLTGWEEPESIFVFRPGQTPETVMFVRPKDIERETWDGFRYGPEGCAREFKIDKTYLITDFDKEITELLKPVDRVYYRFNIDDGFDRKLMSILEGVRRSHGRSGRGNLPVMDSWELIGELRYLKTADDIELMRRACRVTARAHVDVMKATKPGVSEKKLLGVFLASIYAQDADREGYGSIVASGANACTLHYVFNDQVCKDGDLLLIDAGAEVRYYTGDITRTYPVNGKFTTAQRKVYDRVLAIQKELCAVAKPGIPFKWLQDRTIECLTDAMIELGLIKVPRTEAIERLLFKKYYPHGVSHYIGLDVHDTGLYQVGGEARKLEPGTAFTIEPGLYIPADDKDAPEELRGIGIRIEDDVVITATGCENLTSEAPKEVSELEALVGR
ncbi:MAG: aminopeptidase P family protein [Bdellovibrionales bacterium]|nr:aminopeptidase P family protein [Bdellovibrionales bacterium]